MEVEKLGGIDAKNVAIAVCDLQEKFEPSILHFTTVVSNTTRIVKAAKLLSIPVLATEQYPKVSEKNFHFVRRLHCSANFSRDWGRL